MYREQFEDFAFRPYDAVPAGLGGVVSELNRPPSDDRPGTLLDQWLLARVPQGQPEARARVEQRLAFLRCLFQAGYWSSVMASSFLQMTALWPAVEGPLALPPEESWWKEQPPRDYLSFIPEASMGNMLAFQWLNRGASGDLRVFWVRGVGRWLLHHLHDLLEPEGIAGPNVLLLSATSWAGDSSQYHVDIPVTGILREPPKHRAAIARSTFAFHPVRIDDNKVAVSVSGKLGARREEALRQLLAGLCRPRAGEQGSFLDEVFSQVEAPDRRRALFVVQSEAEARAAAEYINQHTHHRARAVVGDARDVGASGLHRRHVGQFAQTGADILVAALLSIERGHNILNDQDQAALGAVLFLTRPHPPPSELGFPLSLLNRDAMRTLAEPVQAAGEAAVAAGEIRRKAQGRWHYLLGHPVVLRHLRGGDHDAFVWNATTTVWQTVGRTFRGGQPTRVYFCDAAFAPRAAELPRKAGDTVHTSLLVAMRQALARYLSAEPSRDIPARDRAVAVTLYELFCDGLANLDWEI